MEFTFKKGPELYQRAKNFIPGGTQLLSKRPEMFLPDLWPAYYKRAKGVEVWDLDDNHLIDVTTAGIGTCILGYADPDVNAAVKSAVDDGSMATLNSPEEVELAELLCELHPWAEMARFTRSGGEALTVAVRIARSATNRDRVAFCGYHGWHDWYLATNLSDGKNLSAHLLPGLAPNGVPQGLKGTAIPFLYNDEEEIEKVFTEHGSELAAVVMEPSRHNDPKPGYLEKIRKLADKHGVVMIFDEVTAAWRMNLGGLHLKYGVNPDMAIFGKGTSNGFALGSVIGTRAIMDAAQSSFISSTYWTERLGFVAGVATIKKMRDEKVSEHLDVIGGKMRSTVTEIAQSHDVPVKYVGHNPLSVLSFEVEDSLKGPISTLYTQECLFRGFLASKPFYPCLALKDNHISMFKPVLDDVFRTIGEGLKSGKIESLLKTRPADSGFKRLN